MPSPIPITVDEWFARALALAVELPDAPPAALALGPCIGWGGGINKRNGYGQVRIPRELCDRLGIRSRITQIHRAIWVYTHGKLLTPGRPIDHLCGVRTCWNIHHLELVTVRENNRRVWMARRGIHGWDRFKEIAHLERLAWESPVSSALDDF